MVLKIVLLLWALKRNLSLGESGANLPATFEREANKKFIFFLLTLIFVWVCVCVCVNCLFFCLLEEGRFCYPNMALTSQHLYPMGLFYLYLWPWKVAAWGFSRTPYLMFCSGRNPKRLKNNGMDSQHSDLLWLGKVVVLMNPVDGFVPNVYWNWKHL